MIKVIKKEDVLKRLDDPKRDYIERRLGEMRQNARILKTLIRERPTRGKEIISELADIKLQLEQAHAE